MLNPKGRLLKALNNKHTDRPPCICPGGMMNMVTKELIEKTGTVFPDAHMDADMMADIALAVYENGCFENYGVPFCMTIEAEGLGAEVNLGTDIYEPHVTRYPIESVKQWSSIPEMRIDQGRAKVVLDAIKIIKSKDQSVPLIGNITGPVSTASSILEPSVFYKELRKENEDAHKLMNFVTEHLIAFARAQIAAGADVIAISDPGGTGEILGPKLFEEFAVTYINRIVEAVKSENAGTIVHICGQMKSVYSQVDKINSDALSFDSLVSMKEARENLGNRVLMGNVSTYTIEFGEPEKIAELTKICVRNGSNIISPACGLGMKSPLKNVQSMLEQLKKEM
ncbi:MAG: MtaA/CmuA family methyltransferase [Clostridia bacterium]|nr:MtaA/CmuA family methyltransferase [Clostridia bacterium]